MAELTELPVAALAEWAQAAYERAGMSPTDAAVVVDAQLQADRRGVDTHGMQRLPWYVERLLAGENNPTPALRIVESWDSGLVLDGDICRERSSSARRTRWWPAVRSCSLPPSSPACETSRPAST
jgi:LDH2 family malate/lactate/ureidoglycolate dehydrogenase